MITAGSRTEVRALTIMDYRQLSSIMGRLTSLMYQSKPRLLFLTQLQHWKLTLFEKKKKYQNSVGN